MTVDLSYKVALIYDYGNYIEVAQRLAKDFKKVYYYNPSIVDGFVAHRMTDIARGVPNIEKVKEWASVIYEVDLVFFTDVFEPDLQNYFRSIGKLVFGSGYSCVIETDRVLFKQVLEKAGLPMAEYEIADGINDLENKLEGRENVWIKSNMRGDAETWKYQSYDLSKNEIRRMKNSLSIFGDKEKYIIDTELKTIGEIGADMFNVNGQYPSTVCAGLEVKDCCYVCRFMDYTELPKQIRDALEALSPTFSQLGYNGWHSNEVIIGEDMKGYLLDCTNRMPQPPTSILMNNITNFSECAWKVAQGVIPNVEYKYKYGCQLIIKSHVASFDDVPIIIPKEYQEFVKIKNLVIDDNGVWYFTKYTIKNPDLKSMSGEKEIGSIVGLGNTLKEAIRMAEDICCSMKSEDAFCNLGGLDGAQEDIGALEKAGIKFM